MTIRIQTRVLPGHRIEVTAPQLPEGQEVEVNIDIPEAASTSNGQGLIEFLRSLPPSTRTPDEWEEYDRQFRAEREAWE